MIELLEILTKLVKEYFPEYVEHSSQQTSVNWGKSEQISNIKKLFEQGKFYFDQEQHEKLNY